MNTFRSLLAGLAAAIAIAPTACSGAPVTVDAAPGAEGAACYPNSTCNAGLACYSKICVKPASDGGGGGGDSSAGNDAASAWAKAACEKAAECYGQPTGFVDGPTCVARRTADAVDMLAAPSTGWTGATLTDCANKVHAASCAEFWTGVACQQKPGGLDDGAPCARPSQCKSFSCQVRPNDTCGTCGTARPVGASCATPSECAFGLDCIGSTCVSPGVEGGPCSGATQLCTFGLACRAGNCTGAATGSACTSSVQDCQTTDFCSSTSNACERDAYAPPLTACGWINADASLWRDCVATPGGCVRSAQQLTGTCPAIAADGQTCDGTNVACAFPAVCMAGVCAFPHAAACK